MKKSEKRELMLRLINEFFEDIENSADKMYAMQSVLEGCSFPDATREIYLDCKRSWADQTGAYFTGDSRPHDRYTAHRALMEMVAFLDLAYEEAG